MENKQTIAFADFAKIDVRIGKVLVSEKIPATDKLLKLVVDFGSEQRTIITAMAEFFEPEYFVGKEIPVLFNLEPRNIKGIESQGMILAAEHDGKPCLLHPEKEIPAGSPVR